MTGTRACADRSTVGYVGARIVEGAIIILGGIRSLLLLGVAQPTVLQPERYLAMSSNVRVDPAETAASRTAASPSGAVSK